VPWRALVPQELPQQSEPDAGDLFGKLRMATPVLAKDI
jgi:hypothetical protein